MRTKPHHRNGVALLGALVTLAVLSLLSAAIGWQILASRRILEHRHWELQASWLARAGVERAAAQLLTDPGGYDGEVEEIIPLSNVRIEMRPMPDLPGIYEVTSESHYPTDSVDLVVRTATRRFRRHS